MSRTKTSKMPLIVVAVTGLVIAGLMVRAGGGEQDLPRSTSAHCDGDTAEVEFGADLNSSRPIRVRYWTTGNPVIAHDVKTDAWRTVDPALPCGTTAHLTVNANDVWGGDTHCWIEVNGRGVAEHHSRLRDECSVTVKLIR